MRALSLLFAAVWAAGCGPGTPGEVIAEGPAYTQGLKQDSSTLYWFGESAIYAVSKEGGEVRTLAEDQHPVTLTAVEGRACWLDLDDVYRLRCVSKEGGEVAELDSDESAQAPIVRNLASDAENLYWANSNGEIRRLPLTGGEAVTFARTDTFAGSLAVGPDHVYSAALGGIVRFAKADASIEAVVGGALVVPQSLTLGVGEDPQIYWVEMSTLGTDALVLAAAQTGSTAALLAQNVVFPSDLAVDDRHVYWASGYNDAHIRRAATSPAPQAEDFASGTRVSGAPVVDQDAVYWLDFEGRIHKAPK